MLAIARDVTEAKLAEGKLEGAAFTDSLTRLANRLAFREALAAALSSGEEAAILFIDLDDFKAVNDLLGHLSGDQLLRQAAVRLSGCVRNEDLIARLGGDEFAVLLRNASVDVGRLMAARMIERLREPYSIEGSLITISACVGIARLEGAAVDEVLKRADIALYAAKRGPLGLVLHVRRGHGTSRRGAALADDGSAGRSGPGRVRRRVSGSRAARIIAVLWVRGAAQVGASDPRPDFPRRVRAAPRRNGRHRIGREWVLDQACRQAAAWHLPTDVAVNLSAVQFRTGDLVDQVSRALARSGLEPQRLQLEITESVLMENSEANLQALGELRRLGVAIVLDDFGTGYSSLSYLRLFAFDKIKIDRSFVAGILDDDFHPGDRLHGRRSRQASRRRNNCGGRRD